MALHVQFRNSSGLMREVKVGFSWTAFFFGGLPFFFRGMPMYGFCWIALGMVSFGISNIFLMFMINKMTAHYYLEHGYEPAGEGWDIAGPKWGVNLPTKSIENKTSENNA